MTDRDRDERPGRAERITPSSAYRPPGVPTPARGSARRRRGIGAGVVLGGLVLLGLLVAVLFLRPPEYTPVPEDAPPPVAAPRQPAEEPPAAAPPDADALLAARQHAEELAAAAAGRRETLEGAAVGRWAQAAFAEAATTFEAGRSALQAREFDIAAARFEAAIEGFDALLSEADEVLAGAIAEGWDALATGEPDHALGAFDLALAIDPESAEAARGRARAEVMDEVRGLLARAREQEQAGELEAAHETLRKARELDAEDAAAREALNNIERALAARAFQRQMSAGLAALERGAYAEAERAFQAAGRIRPGAPEVADARARVRAGQRAQAIAAHRERAMALEAEERWSDAVTEYEAALSLDESLDFAYDGVQRARQRAEYDAQLTYHLDNAHRLQSAEVREQVRKLLEAARAVNPSGPRLHSQIAQLNTQLIIAGTPVTVRFESDARTQVLLHHVGDLGRFERHELELTPGEYTVVGRCRGYRDVRREFSVRPGQSPPPVIAVQCEEPV
jgi:tetratricopeptide (TPR) repeat protein